MESTRRGILISGLSALLPIRLLPAAAPADGERRQPFNDGWRFFKGEAAGAEQPGLRRLRTGGTSRPAARLGHRGALRPQAQPAHRRAAHLRHRLVPQGIHAPGERSRAATSASSSTAPCPTPRSGSTARNWAAAPTATSASRSTSRRTCTSAAQDNVLAVRLTPEDHSSRWYPGAGIYRNVWLDVTGPVHVAHWGTYVTTPEVTDAQATVAVKIEVRNRSAPAGQSDAARPPCSTPPAKRWRATAPAPIPADGTADHAPRTCTVDRAAALGRRPPVPVHAGHRGAGRTGAWPTATPRPSASAPSRSTTQQGFLLNGRHLKLQGVCDAPRPRRARRRRQPPRHRAPTGDHEGGGRQRHPHQPQSALARTAGILRPPGPAGDGRGLRHVAHSQGARTATASISTSGASATSATWCGATATIPASFCGASATKFPSSARPDGWQVAKRLADFFHEEDPTRPTTAGFQQLDARHPQRAGRPGGHSGLQLQAHASTSEILKDHPNWIIVGSETASCVSSRGVYHLPIEKYQKHPSLAADQLRHHRAALGLLRPTPNSRRRTGFPQVLGEFVWTGFDYIGEPTPYFERGASRPQTDWPARSSYFGIVDLAGFPKDRYYLYQSVWTKKPMVHVLPHWNWAGHGGTDDPGDGVHQCRRGGAVPQRQIAGPQEALLRAGGDPGGPQRQRGPEIRQQVPAGVAGAVRAGHAEGGGLQGRQTGGRGRAAHRRRTGQFSWCPTARRSPPMATTFPSSPCGWKTRTATSARPPTTWCNSR